MSLINKCISIAMVISFVFFACRPPKQEGVILNRIKSYGLGFSDTSIHLPTASKPSMGFSPEQDNGWLAKVREAHRDSIACWKNRMIANSREIDSLFWATADHLHLSDQDAQFAKAVIDSLNATDKWEADCWEFHLAGNDQVYKKWRWIPNGEIGGLLARFKKQLNSRKISTKWDFRLKVYVLGGLIP